MLMQKAVSGGFFREPHIWCKCGIICDRVTTAECVPKQGSPYGCVKAFKWRYFTAIRVEPWSLCFIPVLWDGAFLFLNKFRRNRYG